MSYYRKANSANFINRIFKIDVSSDNEGALESNGIQDMNINNS